MVEANVQVCGLLDIQRIVPPGDGDLVRLFLFPYVNGDKLPFDSNFFPVLNFANASIFECLLKFSELDFFVGLRM